MINTIVWNFFGTKNNVSEHCKMLHDQEIINICQTFGIENYNHCNPNIKHLKFDEILNQKTLKIKDYILSKEDSLIISNVVEKYWGYFSLMNNRNIVCDRTLGLVKRLDINSNYHSFYLLIRFFYYIIKNKNIKFVLFAEFPHIALDFALYILAKEMKIKTLCFYQLIIPNKLAWGKDIEDLSNIINYNIDLNPENLEPIKYKVEKPIYMRDIDNVTKKYNKKYKIGLTKSLSIFLQSIIKKPHKFIEYIIEIYSHLYIRKILYKKFLLNKLNLTSRIVSLSNKFVYFPLHLQPELTTITMGGYKYHDQLRAIEDLRNILPTEIAIYVKENPKQIYHNRPEEFFWRISNIKNVHLVEFDTFELINKCIFCATITGTAGFEAIHLKKPTLVFGHAFYNNLEGVFKFNKNIDIEKIINYKINKDKLENELKELNKKLITGIMMIDPYSKIYKNFNKEENIKNLTENFKKIINHIFNKNA